MIRLSLLLILGFLVVACNEQPAPSQTPNVTTVRKQGKSLPIADFPKVDRTKLARPEQDFKDLFSLSGAINGFNSKQLADAPLKRSIVAVKDGMRTQMTNNSFQLATFIADNFDLQTPNQPIFGVPSDEDALAFAKKTLNRLKMETDADAVSSAVHLPFPFYAAGVNDRELVYWDSYFVLEALIKLGSKDEARQLVNNFAYLIQNFGFIPQSNRSYHLAHSNPPLFAYMVEALAEQDGDQVYADYLPYLEAEYKFWTFNSGDINDGNRIVLRNVLLPSGIQLSRYYDAKTDPRVDVFMADKAVAAGKGEALNGILWNRRSAAESAMPESSRWLTQQEDPASINTLNIIPVDLNALLIGSMQTLAKAYYTVDNRDKGDFMNHLAELRINGLMEYCWNAELGVFVDYDLATQAQSTKITAASVVPLFAGICSQEQAAAVAKTIDEALVTEGGLMTTATVTNFEDDAPFGKATWNYLTIKGLERYQQTALANRIRKNWQATVTDTYLKTGQFYSRYNLMNPEKNRDVEAFGAGKTAATAAVFLAL